jgi:hypothetical protein
MTNERTSKRKASSISQERRPQLPDRGMARGVDQFWVARIAQVHIIVAVIRTSPTGHTVFEGERGDAHGGQPIEPGLFGTRRICCGGEQQSQSEECEA